MILTLNKLNIPKCWYHDPLLKDCYGDTVAMKFAKKKIIPP